MQEKVETLTDNYFYAPWQVLNQVEIDDLIQLMENAREVLHAMAR